MGRAENSDFWSRRKAGVEAEHEAEALEAKAAAEAEVQAALAAEQAEKTDAELLEELGLKDPDTMQMGDDFTGFMRRAVPEHLRRRALRRLWLSNPVLANLDGLVDHGEDFSDAAMVRPGMQTAYQVGKGMLHHVMKLAEAAEAEVAVSDEDVDELTLVEAEEAEEVAPLEVAEDPEVSEEVASDAPDRPRRHMRFAYAE